MLQRSRAPPSARCKALLYREVTCCLARFGARTRMAVYYRGDPTHLPRLALLPTSIRTLRIYTRTCICTLAGWELREALAVLDPDLYANGPGPDRPFLDLPGLASPCWRHGDEGAWAAWQRAGSALAAQGNSIRE